MLPLLLPLLLSSLVPLTLSEEAALLFPQTSVFQFTVGASMPIAMDEKGGLAATLGYQFNYALPWNSSQLEPMVVHVRSTRQADSVQQQQQQQQQSLDLSAVYLSLEDLLDRHGWGDARHCMLRTICELAEVPLYRRGDDVVEEIIHLLLTPSEDGEKEEGEGVWSSYEEAERLGRSGKGECGVAYDGCLGSPLDSFTELAHGG